MDYASYIGPTNIRCRCTKLFVRTS